MLSNRPYLLRAMNEWIVDSGMTPHIIASEHNDLEVPDSARQEGRVVLNISPTAVRDLLIDSDMLTFVARFGGVSRGVVVPMEALQAIYARENGRGMMFPDEDDPAGDEAGTSSDSEQADRPARKGPNLRVVK